MAVDLTAIQQDFQRIESKGQTNFMDRLVLMPEGEGSVNLRLLPPKAGTNIPYICSRTHRINGKTFHSPMKQMNGKWIGVCPINAYYQSLWNKSRNVSPAEAEALIAEARAIKPVERFYWNCIQRQRTNKNGVTETNVGPLIFACGKQIHTKILRAMCGSPEFQEDPLGDVTDLQSGRDFKIIKRLISSGAEKYPNYNESKFLGVSVAGTAAEMAKWMEGLNELDSLKIVKPLSELEKEIRIHRGLETADAPTNEQYEYDVQVLPKEKTSVSVTVPSGVPVANAKSAPKSVVIDDDEALLEADFLKQLQS